MAWWLPRVAWWLPSAAGGCALVPCLVCSVLRGGLSAACGCLVAALGGPRWTSVAWWLPGGCPRLPGGCLGLPSVAWWLPGGCWWLPGGTWWLPSVAWWLPGGCWWLPSVAWWLPGGCWWLPGCPRLPLGAIGFAGETYGWRHKCSNNFFFE